MRKIFGCLLSGWCLWLTVSCNLSDFKFDKLTQPVDLIPVIYRPFAQGSYVVKDYATVPASGSVPVTLDSLLFQTINYPLNGLAFNSSGSDSMTVIVKTVNETPMKYRYALSFNGTILDSGTKSKRLGEAVVDAQGEISEASGDSLEYKLDAMDIRNLDTTEEISLNIVLYPPPKGVVLANVLKNARISFRISFRAPTNLMKIKL